MNFKGTGRWIFITSVRERQVVSGVYAKLSNVKHPLTPASYLTDMRVYLERISTSLMVLEVFFYSSKVNV